MSEYTDMLADKYRCHCGACEVQKGNASEEECKICSHYVIREALQIADRVEQADVTKHKKAYYNHDDSEHGDGYCIGFQDGYELALADIRGDAE